MVQRGGERVTKEHMTSLRLDDDTLRDMEKLMARLNFNRSEAVRYAVRQAAADEDEAKTRLREIAAEINHIIGV